MRDSPWEFEGEFGALSLVADSGTDADRWKRYPETARTEGHLATMERHGFTNHAHVSHAASSDDGEVTAGIALLTAERRRTAVMTGADTCPEACFQPGVTTGQDDFGST